MSTDCNFFLGVAESIVLFIYLATTGELEELTIDDYIEGAIIGQCFLLGTILYLCSLKIGPGGPIEALVSSNTVIQILINITLFRHGFGHYEQFSVICGLISIICISLGHEIDSYLM